MMDNSTSARGGETKDDEGIMIMEEGKRDSGHFEASSFCFDGLFAALGELKERGGGLTISMSHPALVSIVDKLSALGMEGLMKKRFYDQLESLRDFSKMHGDCLVPADHPTLGGWVRLQHKHYMLCKKRLPSPLTSKRFTKLKEISGFDEFEKPREKKKDDLVGAKLLAKVLQAQKAQGKTSPSDPSLALEENNCLKTAMNNVRSTTKAPTPREEKNDNSDGAKLWAKALEAHGKASPSDTSLALDEKIRLKNAMNNVRLMVKGTKAFSSSKKKLPDKEVVAAQIREKRAKGTSHRLAVQNSRRMRKKESFSSTTSDNDSNLFSSATSGHGKERDDGPGLATKDRSKDEPPPIADAFEEAIQKKLAEDDCDRPAPAGSTGGGVAPPVDEYERRLKKMIHKLSAEGVEGPAAAAGEGEPRSVKANRKRMGLGDRRRSMPHVVTAPAGSTGGGVALPVDEYERRLKKMMRKLTGEGEGGQAAAARKGKLRPGEATRKNMGLGDRSQSMSVVTGGSGNRPGQQSDDRCLGKSVPANMSIRGSTFEDRLSRKLDGGSLEDIYEVRAGGHGSSVAGEVTRKRMGTGDRSGSMPVGTGGGGNGLSRRSKDRRLGKSVPANMSIAGSTFEDRLSRKLDGESLEEIYGVRAGGNGSSAVSSSLEDHAGDNDSIGSLTSFDEFPRRHDSGSSWMDKLNGPGWDSRDDMGVPGRWPSWTDLDETIPPGRRYSRWKLVFDRSDYDDRREKSDCVSSVLNTIIYSDRWDVVPKENGDVALEMTTQTPDEHKTVKLYVQQLNYLYSRSDFYFY